MVMVLFGLLAVTDALAHKVTIFAWAEGKTIYTESKFSGGKRVQDGTIEVFAPDGTLLLKGNTDDNGEFSFEAPRISDLKILLTAGMGHQNSWTISAAELGGADAGSAAPAAETEPPAAAAAPASTAGVTAAEVEAIVARQLDQKIKPLNRMVVEMQERGPTVADIFGGIGYIIGLVGLGAYMRYRRDAPKP